GLGCPPSVRARGTGSDGHGEASAEPGRRWPSREEAPPRTTNRSGAHPSGLPRRSAGSEATRRRQAEWSKTAPNSWPASPGGEAVGVLLGKAVDAPDDLAEHDAGEDQRQDHDDLMVTLGGRGNRPVGDGTPAGVTEQEQIPRDGPGGDEPDEWQTEAERRDGD